MIQTYTLTTEETPEGLSFLRLTGRDTDANAPFAIVLHGLGRSKEHMLPSCYAFAQAGYQAIAIDARLHGEHEGASVRDSLMQTEPVPTLYKMITGTARDISRVLDAVGAAQSAVHGISLGGYITFAAMLSEPRLAVASVAMGSPDWLEGMQSLGIGPGHPAYDLSARENPLDLAAGAYPPRPLLMLHGDADDVVSVNGVRALYDRLRLPYQQVPERLNLTIYPGLGHQYTDEMARESVDWTKRFLPAQ